VWRNRSSFLVGREEIQAFLTEKWGRELDYALRKQLWAYTDDRIAVRFQYDVPMAETDRRIFGPRAASPQEPELPLR